MQHLLARARWDAGGVRDDLRGYVIEHLGKPVTRRRTGCSTAGPRQVGHWRRPRWSARLCHRAPGQARRQAPAALVTLAPASPAPIPHLPPPAANGPRPGHITIYGWST